MNKFTNFIIIPVLAVATFAAGAYTPLGETFKSIFVKDQISNKSVSDILLHMDEGEIIKREVDEEESRCLTIVEVEGVLSQISELSTMEFGYAGVADTRDRCQVLGKDIPFTENSIYVVYSGSIKAGVDLSEVHVDIDNENLIIYVALPDVEIFSNDINADDIQYDNNFLNPIEPEVSSEMLAEAKESEREKAISEGILEDAENNAQNVIREFLSVFEDYQVEFV